MHIQTACVLCMCSQDVEGITVQCGFFILQPSGLGDSFPTEGVPDPDLAVFRIASKSFIP